MSWPTISAADLNDYKVGAQIEALRTAALADGQVDPFEKIMPDRCNYIRARLSRLTLSALAYSIPPELKTASCWLIIESMQTRLPGLALSDDDKRMIDQAYKDINLAAEGELPITMPDDPLTPDVQTVVAPSMTPKTLTHKRSDADGL